MIKKLYIKKFRIFNDSTIPLGENLTVIAGFNGTGKSNILGLISTNFQLPTSFKTLTNKNFKSEFSEIFKGSQEFDESGNIGFLELNIPGEVDKIELRVTWQKINKSSKEKRFRIIPKKIINDKISESKIEFPIIYLGLSRLYPIGEVPDDQISKLNINPKITEHKKFIEDNYKKILSMQDISINEFNSFKLNTNTIYSGVNTDKYDYNSNSSGQSNLTQILYAISSLKQIKKEFENEDKQWKGGILLIDEIDATLHPSAQIKLIDLLLKFADEDSIQVIFTTHSLQILKHLSSPSENEYRINKNNKNSLSIVYLTTANNTLEIKFNPKYEDMENDMMISSYYDKPTTPVSIFSEDEEARDFIKELLSEYLPNIKLLNLSLGNEFLINFMKNEPEHFNSYLFILDGDTNINKNYTNLLKLPGNLSPEKLFYEYLLNLKSEHPILSNDSNLSKRYLRDNGPDSEKYKDLDKTREKYKTWYKDNKNMFNDKKIIKYWIKDNPKDVKNFIDSFKNSYNIIASKNKFPKL